MISKVAAPEAISDAMHGMNQVVVEGFIDFFTQAVDVDSKRVALGWVVGPDVLDQFLTRDYPVSILHQVFEDLEGFRLQFD